MLRVVLYSLKLNPVIRENENGMSMFCFVYLFLFPLQFWHKQHRVDPTTFQTIPLLHTTFNCALLHTCGCLKPNFLDWKIFHQHIILVLAGFWWVTQCCETETGAETCCLKIPHGFDVKQKLTIICSTLYLSIDSMVSMYRYSQEYRLST